MRYHSIIITILVLVTSFSAVSQHLTISNSGETGTSGTNWSITGNVLNVATSGTADIHPSVISNHLNNVGNLTVVLPWQSGQPRNCNINGSITYTGSATRTLTFRIANNIFMNASNNSISASGTGALNVVLRTSIGPGSFPDIGSISIRNSNSINTNGGHLWMGSGPTDQTWSGLTVGNSFATTWESDATALWIENSTLNTNGGNLSLRGLSHVTVNSTGTTNCGVRISGSSISTLGGSVNINGDIYGSFVNGIATIIEPSSTSASNISTTSGSIYISGYGVTNTNNVGWRHGFSIWGTTSLPSVVSSTSGNIQVEGWYLDCTFNDHSGIIMGGNSRIVSRSGNVSFKGTVNNANAGIYSNDIRFAAVDAANSIRIGFDGTNTYTGNIQIEANSLYQRLNQPSSGSIAIQTSGALSILPRDNAFTHLRAGDAGTLTFDNDWNFGTNLGSFTLGKTTNTADITLSSNLTVAGPINILGGVITLNTDLTSSANGNIFIKGNGTSNPCISVNAGRTINKSAGSGTLTLQGNSRVTNSGTISATGSGVLNVVMWSDFDNSNNDGGVSNFGTISTNGGHVWLGGSNSNGGSYTWNGLTVGDGPSIGSSGYNSNALDFTGSITTSNGHVFVWAGNGPGINGIGTANTGTINTGTGRITLISDIIDGILPLTTSGIISLVPNDGSYASALTLTGSVSSGNLIFNTSPYNGLRINGINAVGGLTIGRNEEILSSGSPVVFSNSSNVTISSALSIAGPINVFGGTITANANLTTTASTGTGISLNGQKIIQNVGIAVTTSGANIDYLASGFSTTSGIDEAIKIGDVSGARASINAGGGNVSLTGSFGTTSVAGNADFGIWLFSTDVVTSGTGSITLTGDATNTLSTLLGYGMSIGNATLKTASGAITLNGTGGKASGNSRGIVADGFSNKIISVSGAITLNEIKPTGLTGTFTGFYMRPVSTVNTFIGADGVEVPTSSSSVTIKGDRAQFDVNGTFRNNINTSGAVIIESVANSFEIAPPLTGLTISGNPSSVRIGKTTNTANISIESAVTAAGPIEVYGGNITVNGACSTTVSNGHINLIATGDIIQSAAISTQGGSLVAWSDTDGASGGRIGSTANISTNGGHIYAGGGVASETLNGLTIPSGYAISSNSAQSGISIAGSTVNSGGGNIRMKGSNNAINGTNTGIIVSNNSTISSGAGSLALYGQRTGDPNFSAGLFLGTEISSNSATGNVTISSTSGDIYLEGTTTGVNNTHSWCHGFAIVEYGGDDVSITSTTGNISLYGDASTAATYAGEAVGFVIQSGSTTSLTSITTDGGSILINGRSSNSGNNVGASYRSANAIGNISIGDNNTGNLTLQFGSLSTNANVGSVALQSAGAYVIEGNSGAAFATTIDFINAYTFGTLGTSFRIGSSTNNQNVWLRPAVTVAGPITAYANEFQINNNLTSTTASDIGIYANTHFWTNNVRQTIQTAGGNIYLYADADANGTGQLELDYLTFNPGSGNTIIRGETFAFAIGVNGPFLNGTGNVTIEPSDASFGQTFQTAWFTFDQDNNGMGGMNLGKSGNTAQISIDGSNITAGGHVNLYGNNIVIGAAITASAHNIGLYANTAVSQTQPIVSSGLLLSGTGTFTLTNASNNFTTLAGGSAGNLLGATQIIDISGGLTIGTVGSNTGLLSSSTIRVETLAGNLTLAGSINTTSTSTDAVILTSAKNTAIGVPTGGDIIVSGSPTITMGSGAIAKLFSGYDQTSTGLTALAGGVSNARYNYDETTTTFNPVLSANNRYAIYRTAEGYGDLTIVSSGGDAEGTTWNYVNGVIKTLSGSANVLNTAIQTRLNSANLSIEANRIIFSANVTGTTSNTLSLLSKTHIVNTIATTITTQGGDVIFASNVDDATDDESTTNGYIQLRSGITINTNGGDITFGGGNVSGSDYSLGSSIEDYTEGIRFDGVIALSSGGGNISLKGKSFARGVQWGFGASGIGFYFFSAATGTINSGTGTVTIDGFSQTHTSSYAAGFYCMNNLTISSSNTTANAITITGKATGTSGEAWGIETEGIFSVLATGIGGGITLSSSQQNVGNNFDIVLRGESNILAASGPISLLGGQSGGLTNGTMFLGNNLFLGSKASSAVPASSSNLTIQYNLYNFSGFPVRLASTGTLDWKPVSASFGQNVATDFFSWGQNSQTLSGLTIGKPGNTGNLYLNSTFTVAGPINAYGGYVEVSGTISNPGTNDIFLKGISNSGSSVNVFGTITKTSGTGTLTMQAHGRAINSGTISATGTGVLNLVMWSDFDGDNVGGGSTLNGGSVSTNGGHVWVGGSNSNAGSYTWNGLTVGDGPSTGASGSNCHAIDLFSPITTNGGDVLLWASNNGGCGISGIQSDGTRHINAGSGDITLIAFQTGGGIDLTSTGLISLLPTAGSYPSALTIAGTLTSGNFSINTGLYNGLKINSIANCGLVIGNFSGHLNNGTSVSQGNNSNVTISSALTTKSVEIYGGAIALNENITTTSANADIIIKAMSNINLAASRTITSNAGDVNLWADSDDNSTGYVQLLSNAVINSNGGDINLGGGSSLATDYAFGTTAETCPDVLPATQYISGVHMRQGTSLNSNGGNISLRGQSANTSLSALSFGISLRGVVMNAGTGRIALNGIANGSGSVNAQGVASWGVLTLRSANTSADAISITGHSLIPSGGSSLGINVVALFEATGVGGGITLTGKSGIAPTNAGVNLGGDVLAVSGPITISGENTSGVVDNIMIGSTTTIGKKSGTNVTTSSSNVILEGNRINTPGSVFVDCSGTLTVRPFGNSFASALTWPMTNVTHASSVSGLTIGKPTNTSNVTFNNATSINGPITAYGGAITVSSPVTAAGNILLDGDVGSFLSQNTKGVEINAAVTTSNNGNITILGRGGSGNAQSGNFGVQISQTVEAGGSGNITVTGFGGLSSNGISGSSHGVNLDGSSAWIKSNGGNVTVTGNGGGANTGTYSQGVCMLNSSRISAGGSGILTITGTGGVNNVMGLRGVVINSSSSVFTAGGAININGYHGTNGSDNSDGVTVDNSTIGSNTSGTITITGTAGGGTGSEAITFANTNTIGGASHAGNVLLRGNSFSISGTNSLLTTGQVTVEPYTNSFSSALTFPISSMTLANTITGLTIGKSTNTANVTFANTTTINGPITVFGGTLALNQNVTSSSGSTISLFVNGLNFNSGNTVTSSGQLIVATQDTAATIGLAGATGTLQLPASYFSTHFTDGFSNIQIGRSNQTGAIATNAFTLRDNMSILTSGTLTLGGKPVLGVNNLTLGSAISSITSGTTNYFQTNGTGRVIRNIPAGFNLLFPVGKLMYNPVSIENKTGSADVFSVLVIDSVFLNGTSGPLITTPHVKATWDISKTNSNGGSGVDFEFGWNQSQENATMGTYRLNHHTGSFWELAAGAPQSTAGVAFKTMLHENYTGSFSPFAIGEDGAALPVEMLSFLVDCSENNPKVQWQTASEHNSSHFNLERSSDGVLWEAIGFVEAAGNSTNVLSYSIVDESPLSRTLTYYRLIQVDIDGKSEVFGPISSNCMDLDIFDMSIVPNPNSGKFVLQFTTKDTQEIVLSMHSIEGKEVLNETIHLTEGTSNYTMDMEKLGAGVYNVNVHYNKGSFRRKMVIH